jgi:hypothetical protein
MRYEDVVFDLINVELEKKFPELKKKVFFANERQKEPQKPFVLLSEINDETIHRTYEKNGNITEFKRATLTFQVNYSCFSEKEKFSAEQKYKAKDVRDFLRALLSLDKTVDYFQSYEMSPRMEFISSNRDRTEMASGGFIYVYEFDMPFDYKETTEIYIPDIGKAVNLEVENTNDKSKISFEV